MTDVKLKTPVKLFGFEMLQKHGWIRETPTLPTGLVKQQNRLGSGFQLFLANYKHWAANNWFVRTPWDNGPFPETPAAVATQPERYT